MSKLTMPAAVSEHCAVTLKGRCRELLCVPLHLDGQEGQGGHSDRRQGSGEKSDEA